MQLFPSWSSISWSSLTYCDNYRSMQYAFSLFSSVVQSANCILLTSKCEARVYICFTLCKSTSILSSLVVVFFLFPLTYSHTILAHCPSANQLVATYIKKKRRNMRTVKCHPKLIQVRYRRRQKNVFLSEK